MKIHKNMRNNIASYYDIFMMKLNQSLLLNTIQSPPSSPDNNENLFNKILMQLNEWLAFFQNLIKSSLLAKFKDTFTTNFFETLSQRLALFFRNLIAKLFKQDTFANFFKTLSPAINPLIIKLRHTFTNSLETLAQLLAVVGPYLIPGAGIVAVVFFCPPVVVGCFAWLAAACWAVISAVFMLFWAIFSGSFTLWWAIFSGFFTLLWWIFRGFVTLLWAICGILSMLVSKTMRGSLSGICCLCGTNSVKMMKAPGTAGTVLIRRAVFQSHPAAYFRNLRK